MQDLNEVMLTTDASEVQDPTFVLVCGACIFDLQIEHFDRANPLCRSLAAKRSRVRIVRNAGTKRLRSWHVCIRIEAPQDTCIRGRRAGASHKARWRKKREQIPTTQHPGLVHLRPLHVIRSLHCNRQIRPTSKVGVIGRIHGKQLKN